MNMKQTAALAGISALITGMVGAGLLYMGVDATAPEAKPGALLINGMVASALFTALAIKWSIDNQTKALLKTIHAIKAEQKTSHENTDVTLDM